MTVIEKGRTVQSVTEILILLENRKYNKKHHM